MLYCTYDQYAAAGGTVPEAAFGVLCRVLPASQTTATASPLAAMPV